MCETVTEPLLLLTFVNLLRVEGRLENCVAVHLDVLYGGWKNRDLFSFYSGNFLSSFKSHQTGAGVKLFLQRRIEPLFKSQHGGSRPPITPVPGDPTGTAP